MYGYVDKKCIQGYCEGIELETCSTPEWYLHVSCIGSGGSSLGSNGNNNSNDSTSSGGGSTSSGSNSPVNNTTTIVPISLEKKNIL